MLQVYLADILVTFWNENENRMLFRTGHDYFYRGFYSLDPLPRSQKGVFKSSLNVRHKGYYCTDNG